LLIEKESLKKMMTSGKNLALARKNRTELLRTT